MYAHTWRTTIGAAAVAVLATASGRSDADVILEYNFAGGSVAASTFSPSVTPDEYVANVGTVSGTSGTHFVNGGLAVGTPEDAITNNWSAEFGLTVDQGMLNLESLDFIARSDNNEVDDTFTWDVHFSLDGFTTPTTSVFSLTHDNGFLENTNVSVDLSGPEFQSLTGAIDFRIYLSTTHGEATVPTSERIRIAQPVTLNGVIDGGAAELQLVVDRDTGEITMSNPGGTALDFIGYEIASGFGSLNAANWTSIDDTYDVNGSGSPTISSDDWTELTGGNPSAPVNGDLSEFDFETNAGASLPAGASISLGVGTWIVTDNENLSFTYVLPDGTEVDGAVAFTGNGDVAFAEGDLNTDGVIDTLDWMTFRSNLGGEFLAESAAQVYRRGDLNGDLDIDAADFVNFRALWEAANPGESFAAMVAAAAAPEPSTGMLVVLLGCISWAWAARKRVQVRLVPVVAIAACFTLAGAAGTANAQITEDFNALSVGAAPGQLPDWTFFDLGDVTNDADWQITDDATSGSTFGSLHLSQAATSTDFFQANQPIGGALAIRNNSDVDAIDVIDFDFALGGFADGSGQFLDTKLIFGFRDVGNFYAVNIVAGQGNGTNTELDISNVQTIDGTTTRTNIFDTFSTGNFSAGFPASPTVLSGQVIHDTLGGTVSVTISEGETQLFNAAVTNEAFLQDGDIGFGVNNDAVSFDNLSIRALPRLTLQVDPVDGDTRIVNGTGESIDNIDLYEITSSLGELDAVAWSSLEEQSLGGFPAGDGSGNGWEAGDLSDSDTLVEAFLTGSSDFGDTSQVYLGQAVADGVTQLDNLAWRYHVAGAGQSFIPGKIEFVAFDPPAGLPGDFNNDGVVDAVDYAVWRDNLGLSDAALNGNGTGDASGLVVEADLNLWKSNYGATNAPASSSASVPEPSSSLLFLLGGVAMLYRRRTASAVVACAFVAGMSLAGSSQAVELDRVYQLGEEEGGVAGNAVGASSFDTTSPFEDLASANGPTYASVSDRPGASGSSVGISFDGVDDHLQGLRFGNPETSRSAAGWDVVTSGLDLRANAKNYTGIRDRGLQLWVKPNSAGSGSQQQVIADTTQFGVLIGDNGNWLLDSGNNALVDSGAAVAFDAWTHVSVVREFGVGTTLFINGEAVTRTGSTYDTVDTSRLVLGSNTEGDEITFSGGTTDFFNGILDQVELFTWGEAPEVTVQNLAAQDVTFPAIDHGDFVFGEVNGFATLPFADGGLSGVAGDVNNDNTLDNADVTAFLAGWRNSNFVEFAPGTGGAGSNTPVGDLVSYSRGDLNFDGSTDISDAVLLHQALVASGAGGLNFDLLTGAVPEPSSAALAMLSLAALRVRRRS